MNPEDFFNHSSPKTDKKGILQGTTLENAGKVTTALFCGGIFFLIILNAQPWIELARRIVPTITTIPFLGSLIKIPFLGGWIQWGVKEMVSILGLLLCSVIQIIELLPILSPGNPKLESLRWKAYAIEFLVCFLRFPPYIGGAAALWEDKFSINVDSIDWWNLIFFLVTMTGFEVAVSVLIVVWQQSSKSSSRF